MNLYLFGVLVSVLAAVMVFALQYTVDKDPQNNKKIFFKIVAAGLLATAGVGWLATRPDQIMTADFNMGTTAH